MAKHRITKHELKEDKFVTGIIRAWHYSKDHANFILGGLVILIVIAGAVYGVISYQNTRATNATRLLSQGEGAQRMEDYQAADSAFRAVVDNFPGTEESQKARFLLGTALFHTGRYDEAIESFEKYIAKPIEGDQDLLISAKVGIAACKEEKKEFADAAAGYMEIVNEYPEYFDRPHIMLSAGRCYQFSNNAQQAVETYRRFIREYEDSPLLEKAQIALAKIETSVM